MYTLKVEFEDFNGEIRTKTLYFNISKVEMSKYAMSSGGGIQARLARMLEEKDKGGVFDAVIDFVDMSYGIKSDDGLHFRKSKQILDDFKSSPAYDAAIVKILTNEDTAQEFIVKILPKDIQAKVAEASARAIENPDAIPQMLAEIEKEASENRAPVLSISPEVPYTEVTNPNA